MNVQLLAEAGLVSLIGDLVVLGLVFVGLQAIFCGD
jgi:hypothetical protein